MSDIILHESRPMLMCSQLWPLSLRVQLCRRTHTSETESCCSRDRRWSAEKGEYWWLWFVTCLLSTY